MKPAVRARYKPGYVQPTHRGVRAGAGRPKGSTNAKGPAVAAEPVHEPIELAASETERNSTSAPSRVRLPTRPFHGVAVGSIESSAISGGRVTID